MTRIFQLAAAALLASTAAPLLAHSDPAPAAPAAVQTPAEIAATLATAPAGAERYSINSISAKHGSYARWTDADGTRRARWSLLLRGFFDETEIAMRRAPDGSIASFSAKGRSTNGPTDESYSVADGKYRFTGPSGGGEGIATPGAIYLAYASELETTNALLDAMMKSPDKSVALIPGGRARLSPLTEASVSANGQTRKLTAYAIEGLGFGPSAVWFEGNKPWGTVGFLSILPEGWEGVAPELSTIQDAALAKRAATLAKTLANPVDAPIAFTNVKMFDADKGMFRDAMTVIAQGGKITAVGAAASTAVPANAIVRDGKGKTLDRKSVV